MTMMTMLILVLLLLCLNLISVLFFCVIICKNQFAIVFNY